MKTFVVIGLGRFGTAVAEELSALGHEVLALDGAEENVQKVADQVTHAVTGDARDPAVLRALGVRNYDCAIVAVGDDVGNSALITLNLKELGVKKVICKAQSLSSSNVLNFIELSEDFGIVETAIPREWQQKTIQELDVRARYKVNIIAMRKGKSGELNIAPGPAYVMESGDDAVVLGRTEDINRLQDL